MMTDKHDELLARVDERVKYLHEVVPRMRTELDQIKGALKLIAVVLVPVIIAVIGAHLK